MSYGLTTYDIATYLMSYGGRPYEIVILFAMSSDEMLSPTNGPMSYGRDSNSYV